MPSLTELPPITLHPGAHRTGTSSLQAVLGAQSDALAARGIALWGPKRTRSGLMGGLFGDPGRSDPRRDLQAARSAGRIAMRRQAMAAEGVGRLLISDENMLGGLRENVLLARLYPTVGPRLARMTAALPGIDRVHLTIRSPEGWWTSCFAFLVARGFAPPDRATLDAVLRHRRTWRHVIADVAAVLPRARLTVSTHEEMAARPAEAAAHLTGLPAPRDAVAPHRQASPPLDRLRARLREEGHMDDLPGEGAAYAPFDPDEQAALRAAHAEDLAWLRSGADGLADLVTRRPAEAAPRDRKGHPDVGPRRPPSALDAAG